jgi:hypothetical protein
MREGNFARLASIESSHWHAASPSHSTSSSQLHPLQRGGPGGFRGRGGNAPRRSYRACGRAYASSEDECRPAGGAMTVRGGRGAAILCAENLCCSLVAATRPSGKFSVMRGHTRTWRPHTATARHEVWHGSGVDKAFPPAWAPKSRVHKTNFCNPTWMRPPRDF